MSVPIVALTATATPEVYEDCVALLHMQNVLKFQRVVMSDACDVDVQSRESPLRGASEVYRIGLEQVAEGEEEQTESLSRRHSSVSSPTCVIDRHHLRVVSRGSRFVSLFVDHQNKRASSCGSTTFPPPSTTRVSAVRSGFWCTRNGPRARFAWCVRRSRTEWGSTRIMCDSSSTRVWRSRWRDITRNRDEWGLQVIAM